MGVIAINASLTRTYEDSVTFNPDGSAEATMTQEVPWSQVFGYIPGPLQPHPDFPNLLYYEGDVQKQQGGKGRLITKYRGVYSANAGAFMQLEASVATTAEPIETCPVFNGNAADPGYDPDKAPVTRSDISLVQNFIQNSAGVAPTTLDTQLSGRVAIKYFNKKLRGIDSYYRPGTTCKIHYITNEIPNISAAVGTIVNPTSFLPDGYPPSIEIPVPAVEGQNYLFSGFAFMVQGGVVAVDLDMTLSGPGGWDIDLYGVSST